MILPDELRLNRESGCAFLVGNGINLYNESCDSWKELTKSLVSDVLSCFDFDNDSLSYQIVFEIAQTNKDDYKNKSAKELIAKKLKKVDETNLETHKKFVEYAHSNNCPILTLNYDNYLVKSVEDEFKCEEKNLSSKVKSSGYYRWCSYYSDEPISENENSLLKSFGIWHIHGDMEYPHSIRFGLYDYINIITKLRNSEEETTMIADDWQYKKTWCDIFFNTNLIVFGTALAYTEIDLYWLLLRRQQFIKNKKLNYITYYVTDFNKEKDICSKKVLLEKIGIKVISQSFDEIL